MPLDPASTKRVLLIAFHFPPFKGGSGPERTLAFCRNLPGLGWQPIVLSAKPMAYEFVSDERLKDIPPEVIVKRAFALDAARHFAVRGRYPPWAALPDRWISWVLGAVPSGWRLIREHRPRFIWSTYPITTAHIVGYLLARVSGLPWIADFRDPMVEFVERTQTLYPAEPRLRNARLRVERLAAVRAAMMVFCTQGAAEIFARRYPQVSAERIHVIPNGYDEASFPARAELDLKATTRLTLVHSGVLYPGPDRDPTTFLEAIRALLDAEPRWRERLCIVLRASAHDGVYRPVIERLALAPWVELAPPLPYRDALEEMLHASGLLVFQGHTSNPAIPAKLYEYFRAGRPIFAMVDDAGDTAALLRAEGVGTLVPIDDAKRIQAGLSEFLAAVEAGMSPVLGRDRAASFERGARAADLARLLDRLDSQAPDTAATVARGRR